MSTVSVRRLAHCQLFLLLSSARWNVFNIGVSHGSRSVLPSVDIRQLKDNEKKKKPSSTIWFDVPHHRVPLTMRGRRRRERGRGRGRRGGGGNELSGVIVVSGGGALS
jgi:hypothetical protein